MSEKEDVPHFFSQIDPYVLKMVTVVDKNKENWKYITNKYHKYKATFFEKLMHQNKMPLLDKCLEKESINNNTLNIIGVEVN